LARQALACRAFYFPLRRSSGRCSEGGQAIGTAAESQQRRQADLRFLERERISLMRFLAPFALMEFNRPDPALGAIRGRRVGAEDAADAELAAVAMRIDDVIVRLGELIPAQDDRHRARSAEILHPRKRQCLRQPGGLQPFMGDPLRFQQRRHGVRALLDGNLLDPAQGGGEGSHLLERLHSSGSPSKEGGPSSSPGAHAARHVGELPAAQRKT
jgi:hypothetical protein